MAKKAKNTTGRAQQRQTTRRAQPRPAVIPAPATPAPMAPRPAAVPVQPAAAPAAQSAAQAQPRPQQAAAKQNRVPSWVWILVAFGVLLTAIVLCRPFAVNLAGYIAPAPKVGCVPTSADKASGIEFNLKPGSSIEVADNDHMRYKVVCADEGTTYALVEIGCEVGYVRQDGGGCVKPVAETQTTQSAPVVLPEAAPASQVLTCSDGRTVPIPLNGQLFPATGGNDYSVVYDPSQSGAADLAPKGWWWQPCLPGPNRQAHEVAIILQQGSYRFIGPECQAWLNTDGNHPFDQGQVLVNRANNPNLTVPATTGHGTEAWIFVRCRASDASGFSFALK